jgi:hypothetical protein
MMLGFAIFAITNFTPRANNILLAKIYLNMVIEEN